MAAPLTPFERTGTWTPTADFPAETAALLAGAPVPASSWLLGYSAGGRPIHAARVGTTRPQTRALIVSGQHGNEVAGPESALATLRDLAWATDPATLTYLAHHEVVILPLASPDGRAKLYITNDMDQNPNRDHLRLASPEALHIERLIGQTNPVVVLDCHENGRNDGNQFETSWSQAALGVDPDVAAVARVMADLMIDAVDGVTTGHYEGEFPETTLTNTAGLRGIPGLLTETLTNIAGPQRVALQVAAQKAVLDYHATHAATLAATVREAHRRARETPATPAGYTLPASRVSGTVEHRRVFGIGMTTATFVPAQQDARAIVTQLYDPASPNRIVAGTPEAVSPDPVTPSRGGALTGIAGIRINGQTRALHGFMVDGRRYRFPT